MKFTSFIPAIALLAAVSATPIPEPQHGGGGFYDCLGRVTVADPPGRPNKIFRCGDGVYQDSTPNRAATFALAVVNLCGRDHYADGQCWDDYYSSYWNINHSSPPS